MDPKKPTPNEIIQEFEAGKEKQQQNKCSGIGPQQAKNETNNPEMEPKQFKNKQL